MTQDISVGAGKYVLGRKLGSGSFGEIYLGKNKVTHEFFAVKLVWKYKLEGRNRKGRIIRSWQWNPA